MPLDAGGPLTVTALTGGQVDVGLLFTSDPAIATNSFVLLEDDKQLQLADNIVPVVRQEVLDANPKVADLLNTVMERLTQEELTNLNKAVTVDARPAKDVATEWIAAQGFDAISAGLEGDITVGSTNFYEQEILGEIFAQMLESNGATVERKFQLGNREIVFPALEAGEIDVLAEYAATALEFVNGGAGQATTDPEATTVALRAALEPKGSGGAELRRGDRPERVRRHQGDGRQVRPHQDQRPREPGSRPVGLTGSDHTCPRQTAGGS